MKESIAAVASGDVSVSASAVRSGGGSRVSCNKLGGVLDRDRGGRGEPDALPELLALARPN